MYIILQQHLYNNLDELIDDYSTAVFDTIQFEEDIPTLPAKDSWGDPHEEEHFTRVFDISGNITFDDTASTGYVPIDKHAVNKALDGKTKTRQIEIGEEPMWVRTRPIRQDGEIRGVLEVGLSSENAHDTLKSLVIIMGITYIITVVTASLGGVFLAGRALSPIDKLTRIARHISAEDLGQRINLQLPNDEVGRLATTFNDMIARLDDAFRRQQQFMADASHEIRTPLTIMKGQIDVALQRERDPVTYQQVLQAVNEQVDRLIRLAGGLLTLTRADIGQIPLKLEYFKLANAVTGAVEQATPMASLRGVNLRLISSNDVTLQADEDLLLQLLLNLIDNAINYTPSGGEVTVGWGLEGNQIKLWVQDTGIGISKEHIHHIFNRFYRVDKARSQSSSSTGLGLAISKWIVEAHCGSISVESTEGKGSTFTVTIPASH